MKNGIAQEIAAAIYDDIEFFARYGFNKAHAADYAVITCQTAYLKAHYPIEYMTALLTVERNNTDKIGFLVTECRRMDIPVLPPDVNHSELDFSIEGCETKNGDCVSGIRFGLGAIKNVGEGPVQVILEARRRRRAARSARWTISAAAWTCGRSIAARWKASSRSARSTRSAIARNCSPSWIGCWGFRRTRIAPPTLGQMTLFGEAGPAADTSVLAPLPNVEEAPRQRKAGVGKGTRRHLHRPSTRSRA